MLDIDMMKGSDHKSVINMDLVLSSLLSVFTKLIISTGRLEELTKEKFEKWGHYKGFINYS